MQNFFHFDEFYLQKKNDEKIRQRLFTFKLHNAEFPFNLTIFIIFFYFYI